MSWLLAQLPYWGKVVVSFGILLSVVPLAGLLVGGSWRSAWRYTCDWARSMGIIFALAAVIGLIALPFV